MNKYVHTYIRTYIQTYRHTDRQTDIQTYRHMYIYIYIYLGHPWDTFSCPDPQKLSFQSFWRFSRPRSKVHALSDSRTVFYVLLAKLRSNYVHIAFELRTNYVQVHSSCAKITYNVTVWKRFMKSRPGQQFLSNFPIVYFFSSGQEKVSWGCPRYTKVLKRIEKGTLMWLALFVLFFFCECEVTPARTTCFSVMYMLDIVLVIPS